MNKKTVGVFFGSRSAEHDVSIITAVGSIIKPLELSQDFNVVPIYIAKNGNWYSSPKFKDIKTFTSGEYEQIIAKARPLAISFDNGLNLTQTGFKNKTTRIDIAFPATHGTHGEDGELMSIFEMANIPYVGCEVAPSAVAMDKVLAKIVASSAGISTSTYEWFYADEFRQNSENIMHKLKELKMPLFVKPAHLGSSIGISRVTSNIELHNAIETAAYYDNKIIVEEAVNNLIEVTVPIMGNSEPVPAMVEKPRLKSQDFFDFDTKYMQKGKKGESGKASAFGKDQRGSQGYSQIPADLPKPLYESAVNTALHVYQAIGCSGIARVDLLIDSKTSKVYFNEVNPLPGSLYTHNWRVAGVSSVGLVTRLIDYALERHTEKQRLATVFKTSFLKQF